MSEQKETVDKCSIADLKERELVIAWSMYHVERRPAYLGVRWV